TCRPPFVTSRKSRGMPQKLGGTPWQEAESLRAGDADRDVTRHLEIHRQTAQTGRVGPWGQGAGIAAGGADAAAVVDARKGLRHRGDAEEGIEAEARSL